MHDKLNRMKEQYESTPIPDELSSVVNKAIAARRTKIEPCPGSPAWPLHAHCCLPA